MRGAVAVHLCRGREWRGGERQVQLLIRTLAWRSGFLQHLVTGRGSTLARVLGTEGPPLTAVPWLSAYDPRALIGLFGCLRGLAPRHRHDMILHAHDSHALAAGLIAARLFRIPCIATRRSTTAPGRLWRLPDRVIAISGAVREALCSAGVGPGRIVVVPSAVSLSALARVPVRRFRTRTRRAIPVILAAGALTEEKGHHTLIEALALLRQRVPGVALVLVGEGPARPELEALVRRLGLERRVRFHGERRDATPFIRAAQVLAQPSLREALGTTVLEAMALGTPVVATRSGGLAELLGDGAGLLVPPADPKALAEGLERVLTDPLLRGAMVHEARVRVRDYDAPGVADRVAEVYRSALR